MKQLLDLPSQQKLPLLDQAMQLLAVENFGSPQIEMLASIEKQAVGLEAQMIGELWEAAYALADDQMIKGLQQDAGHGG